MEQTLCHIVKRQMKRVLPREGLMWVIEIRSILRNGRLILKGCLTAPGASHTISACPHVADTDLACLLLIFGLQAGDKMNLSPLAPVK